MNSTRHMAVAAAPGRTREFPVPPGVPPAPRRRVGLTAVTAARPRAWTAFASLICLCVWLGSVAADVTPEGLEFFEKRVRPVLVESCHKCHSASAEKLKGGLRLDSREGALKGGDTRAAIVPGRPERSLLVEAIGYRNPELQMPPTNKLAAAQIADLKAWIRMGAPWPAGEPSAPVTARKGAFDLAERRRQHWCWQPIRPPPIPAVAMSSWPAQPVDQFILARLEQSGLKPAPPAERGALLRRIYFDLVGLPPTAAEVGAFIDESSDPPAALGQVADRLLASPRFGERWARHWLDLVRYSETLGHEFDYTNPNAWRYRDYVIRALNGDVPYDQFAAEHIAGDLLARPRRHPTEGFNESMLGPAFYWLGQRDHSPVDVRLHQAELIDNQIDVLSKTFLGLTVACARCHDHKFDAIATKDYYALYGVLESSRYAQRSIEPAARLAPAMARLEGLKKEIGRAVGERWARAASDAERYLAAGTRVLQRGQAGETPDASASRTAGSSPEARATAASLDPVQLERWAKAVEAWPRPAVASRQPLPRSTDVEFARFGEHGYEGWFVEGEAFGEAPARPGDFIVGTSNRPVAALVVEPTAHSALLSRRLQGVLRSPTFRIERRYLHVLAAGRESRLNVPVDNLTMIRDPIYGRLKQVLNRDDPGWLTVDLEMWVGHRAYLEFSEVSTPDPSDDGHKNGFAGDGWMAVSRVVFSDDAHAPVEASSEARSTEAARGVPLSGGLVKELVGAWRAGRADAAAVARLEWLVRRGLLDPDTGEDAATERLSSSGRGLQELLREYHAVERELTEPRRVPSMVDGSGLDEAVFTRGNHRTLGESVPRRFLEAIAGGQAPFRDGSGRLELARQVTDPANPLFARVIVNRIWLHLFGRGLVPTPDDFGVLGQAPTHPELLDWLAHWFRTEGGWQPKKLIRLLVTSRAYQMSSRPADRRAEELDPENRLWHRAEARRLEGEAIRDAILLLSGRLDETMFGPPVPIHLTEFMEGRGRPAESGPLDGAGRRSIYVEARRNFVSPLMRAFDTPVPHSTVGRRTVSNVPAQSLMLMNDPFVAEQAGRWAGRLLRDRERSAAERVGELYLATFGRAPAGPELGQALAFLKRQEASYAGIPGTADPEARTWADLCHVLLNVKEFVFVN